MTSKRGFRLTLMTRRVFAATLLTGAFTTAAFGRTQVSLATATPGGGFPLFGDNAAAVINATDPTINVTTRNTRGSTENLQLLEQGSVDIALVAGEPAYEAFSGIGRAPSELLVIAAIYSNPGMFAVRGDSTARTVSDLAGKRVAWGTRASGLTLLGKYVMDGLGRDRDKDFDPVFLEKAGDGPVLVADGSVAALWGGGIGWPGFTAISKAGGRFIGLTEDEIRMVTAKHNFLKRIVVPAGSYSGQKEDVSSVGSWSYILARTDLPDDTAYRLANALHRGNDALVQRLAQARETTPQSTRLAAPSEQRIHRGVLKYLQEIGL